MKRFLFFVSMIGIFASCGSNQDQAATSSLDDKLPKLVFLEDTKDFDFGNLTAGQEVEHSFKFKNEGDFPLIINNVSASCGCTIPKWPREPIGPGESGVILVHFNSKGKEGPQLKTVTIFANTNPATSDIQFKAFVEPVKDSTVVQ